MYMVERDEAGDELEHRQVVGGRPFPPNEQAPKSVVPAVRALDEPAARLAFRASKQRRLAPTSDVRHDAAGANSGLAVLVVVALVEA